MKKTTFSSSLLKRNFIVEIIASLLLIFFVHTLISTYINLQSLKNMLPFYTRHNNSVAWIVVIVESVTILLLFFSKTRIIGLAVVLTLSIIAGYIVIKHPSYPHHFGGILNHFSDTQHIVFYSFLSAIAIISSCLLLLKRKRQESSSTEQVIFT
jgi:hypothetical protein